MAFVNLAAKSWGSSPDIAVTPAYEMQRSGANMQYRIKVTLGTVTGQSYFGYPIYLKIYLQNSLKVTATLKNASPSQWSSAIEYTSSWFTINDKTSGTTSLSLNLYSGTGSTRNNTYSYSLPIVAAGSVLGTISNFTLGNAMTIPITKYDSSFYDVLTISVGGTTVKTINGIANGASVTFTATELTTIYSKLPNATSGTFTFKLTTKTSSSGTSVGTSTKTATGTIPTTVKPTISSITLTEAVSGLAAKFAAFIQNQSKITGTVNATAGSGATIASYKTVINGSTYTAKSFTTGVLKTSGTNTVSVTVIDSRGRSATYSTTFNVLAYVKPNITTFTVKRATSAGALSDEGTSALVTLKADIASLNSKNNKTYTLQYKLSSATSWTTVTTSLTAYAINTSFVASGVTLNVDNVYNFRITATDYFGNHAKTAEVASSFTLINYGSDGKSIAFGRISQNGNTFDVGLTKTFLSNNTYLAGEKRNDVEKNLHFTTTDAAANKHNMRLYGGSANSTTSIGIYDTARDHPVFRYQTSTLNLIFEDVINLKKGSYDISHTIERNIGTNRGRVHFSNGLLIQWGVVSITPTAANTPTSIAVSFPVSYTYKPCVYATAQLSTPQVIDVGIGQGGEEVASFTIYITRTNTYASPIHWLAIGYKEV